MELMIQDKEVAAKVTDLTLIMGAMMSQGTFASVEEVKAVLRRDYLKPEYERHPAVNTAIAEVRKMKARMC